MKKDIPRTEALQSYLTQCDGNGYTHNCANVYVYDDSVLASWHAVDGGLGWEDRLWRFTTLDEFDAWLTTLVEERVTKHSAAK